MLFTIVLFALATAGPVFSAPVPSTELTLREEIPDHFPRPSPSSSSDSFAPPRFGVGPELSAGFVFEGPE